ncbi:MAG: arylsulfatase [Bacteroidetes bacterium]|nr:arylsulfatase [Bacteroidota bacterium]
MKYSIITLIIFVSLAACNNQKNELPNIIFIMADDMGYGDLTCLNKESKVPTPNMDRIADEGMIFADAHSPSAVCTPTRYGGLTGRYCFRSRLKSGVLVGHSPSLIEPDRMTVAGLLKNAGYNTACIGKWHLGLDWGKINDSLPLLEGGVWAPTSTDNVDYENLVHGGPSDHGFDFSFIIPASLDMTPYCYISNRRLIAPITSTTAGKNDPRGVFWRPGDLQEGFTIEGVLPRITAEAVRYIHRMDNRVEPFFLYFPLSAPHTPWVPLEDAVGKSEAGLYGDFVYQVDQSIGLVLDALDQTKQAKNTLIIVTSDNGAHWTPSDKSLFPHLANAPFSGMKSDVWEGGHHVPYILRWPQKVKKGQVTNEITTHTDLFATVASISGQSLPDNAAEDSYSMLPVILGEKLENPIRPGTIHHSISGMFSLRKGDWKYIDGRGSGGWTSKGNDSEPEGQLYNVSEDITESNNLFLEEPEIVKEMQKLLHQYISSGKSRY